MKAYLKDVWDEGVVVLVLVFIKLLQVGQILVLTVISYLVSYLSLLFSLREKETGGEREGETESEGSAIRRFAPKAQSPLVRCRVML